MKIRSLKVKDFFILKDFKIEFNDNLSVLIGENGSGKSTILELIADIFGHLHKFFILGDKTAGFVENYEIVYDYVKENQSYTIEIHSQQYVDSRSCTFVPQIWINGEELSISQIEKKYGGMATLLPQKTILNYAGISDHLRLLSQHFEEKYKAEIIKVNNKYSLSPLNLPKNRPFIYIKPKHLSMLVLSLFLSDEESDVNFIREYLGIDKESCQIELVFKKPSWAKKTEEKWWGISGNVAQQFFQTIEVFADETEIKEKEDLLIYRFIGSTNLEVAFEDLSAYNKELAYTILDTLFYDDLLSEIKIFWELEEDEYTDLSRLSEGQKQIILTQGTNLVFGKEEKNLLFLYDEPDVFLHPKWQKQFVSNIKAGLDSTSMAIITSHSPSIVSDLQSPNLHLLRGGKVVIKALKHYGKTVESILGDYFGLESTRSSEVSEKIDTLWDLIEKRNYEGDVFAKKMKELISIIGPEDAEILAMNREIMMRRHEKAK